MYLKKIDDPQNYKAALYLRLSKEDDNKKGDDSESIKNQRSVLEGFAKEQKLTVYDEYVDDGYSGTNFERPGFRRLIRDIEDKKINMVITKDMSRLGRNYTLTGQYMEEFFPEHDVRYIALLDNIDTGSDSYFDDITPFKSVMNEFYAKDISRKITSTKRNKQKEGKFIGWKAAYGYKRSQTENGVLVIDEPAAKNVRYIFQLALEGKSCRQIAMILNDENIPTPAQYAGLKQTERVGAYSGKWSSESISFMLQNEVYIGSMVQGRMQKVSFKSKKSRKLPKEEWTVVKDTHEPIIDQETFEKVALLIKSRTNTRSRTYDYLLKGIIFCHECGYPLGVMNRKLANNRNELYFACRTYQRFTQYKVCTCHGARVNDVTNTVMEQIRSICSQYINRLNLSEVTDSAQKMLLDEKRRLGKDLTDIKNMLKAVDIKIDKCYNDHLSGIVDKDLFIRNYKKLKDEKSALKNKIQALENSDENDIQLNAKKVRELVESFLNAEEYSRELIVSLIEKIELTENKEVLIYFRFKELNL